MPKEERVSSETALNVEQVSFQNVSATYVPVPEPSSLGLLAFGAAAALRRRRS